MITSNPGVTETSANNLLYLTRNAGAGSGPVVGTFTLTAKAGSSFTVTSFEFDVNAPNDTSFTPAVQISISAPGYATNTTPNYGVPTNPGSVGQVDYTLSPSAFTLTAGQTLTVTFNLLEYNSAASGFDSSIPEGGDLGINTVSVYGSVAPVSVPEPGSLVLLAIGLLGGVGLVRRRSAAACEANSAPSL